MDNLESESKVIIISEFVRPNVFVSDCLEFNNCRFDGTMISDEFVRRMKPLVNFIHTCPELAIGLSSPREAIRLVKNTEDKTSLVGSIHGQDFSEAMLSFSSSYIEKLQYKEIDGFLLKAKSPSCGVGDVKIYHGIGKDHLESARNDGFFGGKIKELFPDHPIETERRISNYNIREQFLTAIFTLADFRELKQNFEYKKLAHFHSKNKYLFMAYNQSLLKKLGNLIANHDKLSTEEIIENYETGLRKLLSSEQSKKQRINVLSHIYGYFKKLLNTEEKEFYFNALDDYVDYRISYSNVLYILRGYAVRFQEKYLLMQTVFEPFPKQLLLTTDSGNKI